MFVDVIYKDGVLKLGTSVQLKSRKVAVPVVVSDGDTQFERHISCNIKILKSADSDVGRELNRILGTYRCGGKENTAVYDKTRWHQHIVEKYFP